MIISFKFVETSPSAAGTAASSASVSNAASYLPAGIAGPLSNVIQISIILQAAGATGGTLDCYAQMSESGDNWFDVAHFPQIPAAASSSIVGGALGEGYTSLITIGQNLSPALAANAIALGGWGTRLRLVFVAGVGTTAGTTVNCWVLGQRPEYGRRY